MSSFWISTKPNFDTNFPKCTSSIHCDVCIIGGGITGIVCAYYLSKAGKHVILLEQDELAYKTTGNTTAKITSQHDLFYDYLIQTFGESYAKQYLNANEQAILDIENIIQSEQIDCDFEQKSAYVFTQDPKNINSILKEVAAMKKLNFDASYIEEHIPLTLDPILGAICFPNQAQFHPRKYLEGLSKAILENGGEIFEYSKVTKFSYNQDISTISLENGINITAPVTILATRYPFLNLPGFYFMKMYQSTSYVIGLESSKIICDGMFISCDRPNLSFRSSLVDGKKIIILAGCEHKTGTEPEVPNPYSYLESIAKKMDPHCKILYHWSTEDCISVDKIPYIGNFSTFYPNLYLATGFKKWGMTFSHIAAQILTDAILGKENSYANLFSSTRYSPIQNKEEVKNIVKESVQSLFLNKLSISELDLSSLKNGDGDVFEIKNQKLGVYRDENGKLYGVKPICSHLGCLLHFNSTLKTWDCPCHGSRYNYLGKCIYGPSNQDIPQITFSERQ